MTIMGINYLSFVENKRSNLAREAETTRHNVETENLGTLNFGETVRSNRANEDIRNRSLDETTRHDLAMDQLGIWNLGETVRANKARETENIRSNVAREVENNRSHVVDEKERERLNTLNLISRVSETAAALKASERAQLNPIEWLALTADSALDYQSKYANNLKDLSQTLKNLGIKIPNF